MLLPFPLKYHKALEDIVKAKKDFEAKKLTKQEINKVRRESREFIRLLMDLLDNKRAIKLDKAKIQFRYGDGKYGEVIFLKEVIFVIKDHTKRDEILIGNLDTDGGFQNLKKSDSLEFEKYINSVKMPQEKVIKTRTLESIKEIVGEDVEVLWKA